MNTKNWIFIGCAGLAISLVFSGCGKKDQEADIIPIHNDFPDFSAEVVEEKIQKMDTIPAITPPPPVFKPEPVVPDSEVFRDVLVTNGNYVLQVGVSETPEQAQRLVRQLDKIGIPSYVAEVRDPADLYGTYYRIRVGYFRNVTNARLYGHNVLKPAGYAFWIDNKSNDNKGNPASADKPEPSFAADAWQTPTVEQPTIPKPAPVVKPVTPAPTPSPTPSSPVAPTQGFDDWDAPPVTPSTPTPSAQEWSDDW
jgi:hypothetical protein